MLELCESQAQFQESQTQWEKSLTERDSQIEQLKVELEQAHQACESNKESYLQQTTVVDGLED